MRLTSGHSRLTSFTAISASLERRNDLKVIITSACIDTEKFAAISPAFR